MKAKIKKLFELYDTQLTKEDCKYIEKILNRYNEKFIINWDNDVLLRFIIKKGKIQREFAITFIEKGTEKIVLNK